MRIKGHALCRGTDKWFCKCGEPIKDPSAGRALARDVYRFHLRDVQMAEGERRYWQWLIETEAGSLAIGPDSSQPRRSGASDPAP